MVAGKWHFAHCVGKALIKPEPYLELSSHGKIADKNIHKMDAFYDHVSVDKYVIMPDHIHLLIRIDEQNGHPGRGVPTRRTSVVSRFVGTLKRFCNKEYGGNVWQRGYYDHVVRDRSDYDDIYRYIETNPTQWELDEFYAQ